MRITTTGGQEESQIVVGATLQDCLFSVCQQLREMMASIWTIVKESEVPQKMTALKEVKRL